MMPFTLKDIEYKDSKSKWLNNIDNRILWFLLQKSIEIKPLEVHKNSIVIEGFNNESYKDYIPKIIEFRGDQSKYWLAEVTNSIITLKIAIIYVDNDIRQWSYTNGIILYLIPQITPDDFFRQFCNSTYSTRM